MEKKAPKFKTVKMKRKEMCLELVKNIRTKIISLKHGYIADEEFKELTELIKKL